MKKKLPISYVDQPSGECWTFYKYAILRAHPVAAPWLVSHIEFYIDENMRGGYGDTDCDYYRMRYYSDILTMMRIPVSDVTEDEIVSTICGEIDNGHYIVMYLNYNRLFGKAGVYSHEILIYGYDEEKALFYSPLLSGGSFKETEITFESIAAAYKDVREEYMRDGWQLLALRSYYFGITSICVRRDYQNDNFVADLVDKLDHEIHGKRIVQTVLSDNDLIDRVCYTGNACFVGLSTFLRGAIEAGTISKTVSIQLMRTLRMMYDYRRLMLFSIEWFAKMVNGQNDTEMVATIRQYAECSNIMHRCCLMLCKYELKENISILDRVRIILDDLQKKEAAILVNFRESIFPYYYQMNGVPMPLED